MQQDRGDTLRVGLSAAVLSAALLLTGCDEDTARGSASFDVIDMGSVGKGRLLHTIGFVTDRETGCQYIATAWREVNLTPRMGADGRQVCVSPTKATGGVR